VHVDRHWAGHDYSVLKLVQLQRGIESTCFPHKGAPVSRIYRYLFPAASWTRGDDTGARSKATYVVIACSSAIADTIRMATYLAILMTGLYNGLYGDHTDNRSEGPDRGTG
jgi:hypothetical protein